MCNDIIFIQDIVNYSNINHHHHHPLQDGKRGEYDEDDDDVCESLIPCCMDVLTSSVEENVDDITEIDEIDDDDDDDNISTNQHNIFTPPSYLTSISSSSWATPHLRLYVCMYGYVCMYVCMDVCIYIYVCMNEYMCVCMCVCMYI